MCRLGPGAKVQQPSRATTEWACGPRSGCGWVERYLSTHPQPDSRAPPVFWLRVGGQIPPTCPLEFLPGPHLPLPTMEEEWAAKGRERREGERGGGERRRGEQSGGCPANPSPFMRLCRPCGSLGQTHRLTPPQGTRNVCNSKMHISFSPWPQASDQRSVKNENGVLGEALPPNLSKRGGCRRRCTATATVFTAAAAAASLLSLLLYC